MVLFHLIQPVQQFAAVISACTGLRARKLQDFQMQRWWKGGIIEVRIREGGGVMNKVEKKKNSKPSDIEVHFEENKN